MKTVLRFTLIIALVAVVIGTFFFLYQKSKPEPEVFETKNPEFATIVKKTVATGSIVPRKEIDIKPTVSGIIEELYVEPGDKVKAGDIIAKVKVIPNMLNLNNAESRLANAKISVEQAQKEYDRQKALYDQKVIAEASFLDAQTQLEKARAELDASENNLQLIKEGALKKSGKTSNTLIRSTIAGMVLEVPVEVGRSVIESNTFNDGTTIATVANMQEMIFKGKVDESEVGKLRSGMELVMTIGAIEDDKFKAELEYIAPKGKEENGAIQFEIRARMQLKPDQFIRAGYSANADIVLDRRENVLALDEALIDFRHDSAFVQVEKSENTFEERYVRTGLSDGINIEVLEGVVKEDRIKIINGAAVQKPKQLANN